MCVTLVCIDLCASTCFFCVLAPSFAALVVLKKKKQFDYTVVTTVQGVHTFKAFRY